MSTELAGRVVIVSGAGSGLGLATALAAARAAATVIGIARSGEALEALAHDARAEGFVVRTHVADLTDPAAARAVVSAVSREHDHIDGLATFAGEWLGGSAGETTPEQWQRAHAANLGTCVGLVSAVLPAMVRCGAGSIVTVGSNLALKPAPHAAAYVSAKAAVVAFTKSVALDYGKHGVRANCLCPGLVRTPMTEGLFGDRAWVEREATLYPLGRFGTGDDVAQAALFLLSPRSSWITGTVLPVDGGWSLSG